MRRAEMELERLMSPDLEPLPEPESSVDELTGELDQTSRSAIEEAARFAEDLAREADEDASAGEDDREEEEDEAGSEIEGVIVQRAHPPPARPELGEEESFEYAAMRYDGGEVSAPVSAVYSPKRREPRRMFKPKKSAAQRRLERLGIKKPEEDEEDGAGPEVGVLRDADRVLGTAEELAERRRLMAENFERLISGQDAFILEDELLGGGSPTFQPTQYRPSPTKPAPRNIPVYQDPERDAEIAVELRARERELAWRREKREREEKALEAERRRFEVLKRELEEIESRRREQTYEKERRKAEEMELRRMRMENRRLERLVANDRAELDNRHVAGDNRKPGHGRHDRVRHKNAPLFKRMEKAYHFNVEMEIERERREVLEKRRAKMYGAKPGLSYAQLQFHREQEAKQPTWQKNRSGLGVPPGGLPAIGGARTSIESLDGVGPRMSRFERMRREEKARARREEIAKYELAERKRRYGEMVKKQYKPSVSEKARSDLLKRKDVARPGFEDYHAESLDALSPSAADDVAPLPRIVPNREVAAERGQEVFFEYDVHGRKVLVDPYEEHDMNSPFRPQRPGAKLAPSPRRQKQKPKREEEPIVKNPQREEESRARQSQQETTPAEHLARLSEERHRLERELLSVEYTYRNGRLIGRPVERRSFGSPVASADPRVQRQRAPVPSRGHPSWPDSAGTDGYVGGGEFIPRDYVPQAAYDEIPVGGGGGGGMVGGGGVLSETAVNRHAAREDQGRRKGKGFRTMLRERQIAAVEARMSKETSAPIDPVQFTPTPPPPRTEPRYARPARPPARPPVAAHDPPAPPPVAALTPEELEEIIANAGPDDVPPMNVRVGRYSFGAVYDESPAPKPRKREAPPPPQLSPTQLAEIVEKAGPDDVPPIVGSVGAGSAVSWEERPAMSRANFEATRAQAAEEEAARRRAEDEGERLARLSGDGDDDDDDGIGAETLVAADTLPPGVGIGGAETDAEEESDDDAGDATGEDGAEPEGEAVAGEDDDVPDDDGDVAHEESAAEEDEVAEEDSPSPEDDPLSRAADQGSAEEEEDDGDAGEDDEEKKD